MTIQKHTDFLSFIRASYTAARAQNTVPRITAVAYSLCSKFPTRTLRHIRTCFEESCEETNRLIPAKYYLKRHYRVTNSMQLILS